MTTSPFMVGILLWLQMLGLNKESSWDEATQSYRSRSFSEMIPVLKDPGALIGFLIPPLVAYSLIKQVGKR